MAPEPNFLLSNRSYWYPQNTVSDYATASLRITVPQGYTCVASGDLGTDNDVTLRDLLTSATEAAPMSSGPTIRCATSRSS
jgi:hypothetical protein